MKKLQLAVAMLVFGVMVCNSKAFAQSKQQPLILPAPKLELQPQSTPTRSLQTDNNNNVENLVNRAYDRFKSGEYQAAIEDCNKVLQIDQNNLYGYFLRGFARVKLEDYKQAIPDFNQVIRIDPKFAYAYFGRGLARIYLDEYKDAISDFNQTIQSEPNFAEAYLYRGIAYGILKDKPKALADLQKANDLFQNQGKLEQAQATQELIQKIRQA